MDFAPASPTLVFLFTDLEGSTRTWERSPDEMKRALERHDAILSSAVSNEEGRVVKTTGDGIMAVFATVGSAVKACLAAQHALAEEPWGATGPLRVRMGLHAGQAQVREQDYFGPAVIRAARLMAVGHGGQVLLSEAAAALVMDELPDVATLLDLGTHRLKDLGRPEHIFQLVDARLGRDFPPLVTHDARPNNLPILVSTFVGRGIELAEITRRLKADPVRLLTLTGPGGTGKTRLAVRVGADMVELFDDGVVFVDLFSVRDVDAVVPTVARAIGVAEKSDQSLFQLLTDYLRPRRQLLILDNFEQVTGAGPVMVELLDHCPELKLLVTSREPLHVRGENVFAVPPLSLPPAHGDRILAELVNSEAVQLFVERAEEVRSDFRLTDRNAAAVAEICLRVDGLPLAIELAAARLNLFSVEELRNRLGERLKLLRGGARDLPTRQQALRATIEWSYQLLDPGEQRLFELLSVFATADLPAAEEVAGNLRWITDTGVDVLDGVASLVDKSLVRHVDTGSATARLTLLETIREYAAGRLDAAPDFASSARRAHAAYFADYAERQYAALTGPAHESALLAMMEDVDNLRMAWAYWVAEGDLDALNKLVNTLWLMFDAQGWYQRTVELTTDLLRVLTTFPRTAERAAQEVTLQTGLARALWAIKGFSPEVEDAYALAVGLLEQHDFSRLFPVLRSLSSFYIQNMEFEKAARLGREILRLAEREGDASMLAEAHLVLGTIDSFGDLPSALEHLDEAVSYSCSHPYRPGTYPVGIHAGVASLIASALDLWLMGYPEKAQERGDRAVALATESHHPYTLCYGLFHAGYLSWWRREPRFVRERAVDLLNVVDVHDFALWRAVGKCLLGAAHTALGRTEEGLVHIGEGMEAYRGLKTPPIFWPLLLMVHARVKLLAGRPDEALGIVDEALRIAEGPSRDTFLPERYLLKGDVLAALPDHQTAEVQALFENAADVASELGVRMSLLRAATRLCRLARGSEPEEHDRRRRLLQQVYDEFTEGFDTADLIDARALLESRDTA